MKPDFIKSFAASFLLHSLLFISVVQQPDNPTNIEVEFGKPQKGIPNGLENKQEKIIEKKEEVPTKGEVKKNESGFWGIGVAMTMYPNAIVDNNGNQYPGLLITDVYPNYPAHINGVRVNDVIYQVDGKIPNGTNADLRGVGPDPITLQIIRNNQRITLKFNRDWTKIEGN